MVSFFSRDLTARRSAFGYYSGEFHLEIDELEAGLAGNVTGLRKQLRNLKDLADDIESGVTHQKNFISQLPDHMIKMMGSVPDAIVWNRVGRDH